MSDYEDSTIAYTAVSSPFRGLLDIGSLGVDGPPMMPEDPYAYVVAAFQAPPVPDYVSGPEHLPSPVYLPEFVPEPVYLKFMPVEDDILPAEEEPLPTAASPTIESPSYIDESDPDEDSEEDPKDDPEEGMRNRMKTEPFETDESTATPPPHPVYRITTRMSIRPRTPISLPSDTDIATLMAIHTPPPSPLSLLSLPLPQIPSPPLPLLSPPPTDPTYEEAPLGYRASILRWGDERREIPEADPPLRKRLSTAHTSTYKLGESSAAVAARLGEPVRDDLYRFVDTVERGEGFTPAFMEVGYGITDAWDDLVGAIQEIAPTTVKRVNQNMTEISTTFDLETSMIYAMIKEKWDDQALQRAQVSAQQTEITDLRVVDRIFQTTVRTQHEEIRELRAVDRKLQARFIQALTALKSCHVNLGVAKALAARNADRNTNDDDNYVSRTGARRTERFTHECTYPDFMKLKKAQEKDKIRSKPDKNKKRGEAGKSQKQLQ
uniref:Reverse transcriptase domain-containing protein n=1 Tax=Tanacetum cinerariifolium TaxID=118510 RepID=A0A699HL48_TANCI|nr:hypothetical protein [Tanacetum cinerariifolium]